MGYLPVPRASIGSRVKVFINTPAIHKDSFECIIEQIHYNIYHGCTITGIRDNGEKRIF